MKTLARMKLKHLQALLLSILLTVVAPFASAEVSVDTLFSPLQSPSTEIVVPVESDTDAQMDNIKKLVDGAALSIQEASSTSKIMMAESRIVQQTGDLNMTREYCLAVIRASRVARPLMFVIHGNNIPSVLTSELESYIDSLVRARDLCTDLRRSSVYLQQAHEHMFKILENLK
jgi:hypothetical protein